MLGFRGPQGQIQWAAKKFNREFEVMAVHFDPKVSLDVALVRLDVGPPASEGESGAGNSKTGMDNA